MFLEERNARLFDHDSSPPSLFDMFRPPYIRNASPAKQWLVARRDSHLMGIHDVSFWLSFRGTGNGRDIMGAPIS